MPVFLKSLLHKLEKNIVIKTEILNYHLFLKKREGREEEKKGGREGTIRNEFHSTNINYNKERCKILEYRFINHVVIVCVFHGMSKIIKDNS